MPQANQLKFQRTAATKPEGEDGKVGEIVIMPVTVLRWR